MDTVIYPQKFNKIVINGSILLLCLLVVANFIKSPPPLASENYIAQNPVPVGLNIKQSELNIKREIDRQHRIREFDVRVAAKYQSGIIYDIDSGVKRIKLTKYYKGRPVKINVIEINRDINPNLELSPTLSSNTLASKSTIRQIAQKNNAIVAINGTFFKPQTGVPLGTLMIDGEMYTGPIYDRVALGIFDKSYDMARVKLDASIKSSGKVIKVDNINQPRMLSTYVLVYTPQWGKISPPSPKYGIQIQVTDNKISAISTSQQIIPKDGYVIVAPQEKLSGLKVGKKIDLDILTSPSWDKVKHIVSGGPYLVKNNEVFIDMTEQKLSAIGGRNPRTAIGYTAYNDLIMVVVDGREHASIGMTLNELAHFMKGLGCVNAMNLDGGGSTVMYVNGRIVNNPQIKGGIALSNAITLSYASEESENPAES